MILTVPPAPDCANTLANVLPFDVIVCVPVPVSVMSPVKLFVIPAAIVRSPLVDNAPEPVHVPVKLAKLIFATDNELLSVKLAPPVLPTAIVPVKTKLVPFTVNDPEPAPVNDKLAYVNDVPSSTVLLVPEALVTAIVEVLALTVRFVNVEKSKTVPVPVNVHVPEPKLIVRVFVFALAKLTTVTATLLAVSVPLVNVKAPDDTNPPVTNAVVPPAPTRIKLQAAVNPAPLNDVVPEVFVQEYVPDVVKLSARTTVPPTPLCVKLLPNVLPALVIVCVPVPVRASSPVCDIVIAGDNVISPVTVVIVDAALHVPLDEFQFIEPAEEQLNVSDVTTLVLTVIAPVTVPPVIMLVPAPAPVNVTLYSERLEAK
jgi:hypothetical protein